MRCPGTESQVILIAVTKRSHKEEGRLRTKLIARKETRVTDIQRDDLKECQGRKEQE